MAVSPPTPAPARDPTADEARRPEVAPGLPDAAAAWLHAFHTGERACLERCYREHVGAVEQVIGPIVSGPDRETLVHEVFFRLLTEEALRRRFAGGAFVSWLRVVARNQAIDSRAAAVWRSRSWTGASSAPALSRASLSSRRSTCG